MKITRSQLKQLIKEELAALHVNEAYTPSADENALLNVIAKDFFEDKDDEAQQFLSWWNEKVDTSNNPNSKRAKLLRDPKWRAKSLTKDGFLGHFQEWKARAKQRHPSYRRAQEKSK